MTMLRELNEFPHTPLALRKFGWTLGAAFGVLAALLAWRDTGLAAVPVLAALAAIFLAAAFLRPEFLRPAQLVWMGLALVIGWVMTRVILCAVFCLIFTPIGLLLRLRGKDLLCGSFPAPGESCWTDRAARPKSDDEKQF